MSKTNFKPRKTEKDYDSLALEIVDYHKKMNGESRPMKTIFYYIFAGRYMSKECTLHDISCITAKQFQEAKHIIYGDKFEMR